MDARCIAPKPLPSLGTASSFESDIAPCVLESAAELPKRFTQKRQSIKL